MWPSLLGSVIRLLRHCAFGGYPMARCDVCGKGPQFGNNVSHSMRHTKRRWNVNVQRMKVTESGTPKRIYICAKCLKTRQKPA
jgi:large subunit ribosomal protein L28